MNLYIKQYQMMARLTIVIISILLFSSQAIAWDTNVSAGEGFTDTSVTLQTPPKQIEVDNSMDLTNAKQQKEIKKKHHSISIEYDILTLYDFGVALGHIFDDKCEKLYSCSYGAISIDYGYAFDYIESGFVLNLFLYDSPITTAMAKIKINGNLGGFINPFFEIDAGISFTSDNIIPMGHISVLGLEIGYPVSVRFQVPFLLWGVRGLTNIGIGYRF